MLVAQVLQLLAENTPEPAKTHFGSFYSSALGGIVTEPGFMLVSIDDAMVNKGDAVYESVSLTEGYLYKLDARMARFLDSADLAGLPLPFSEERLRRILLDTAAASLKLNGERHRRFAAALSVRGRVFSLPTKCSSSSRRRAAFCNRTDTAASCTRLACRHVDVLAVPRAWRARLGSEQWHHFLRPPQHW